MANFMTPEEIEYSCRDVDTSGLNEIIFKNTLNKQERNELNEEEHLIRKKIHRRKTLYRYKMKNPEKAMEKLEKLKELNLK